MSRVEVVLATADTGSALEFDADLSEPDIVRLGFEVTAPGQFEIVFRLIGAHDPGNRFRLRVGSHLTRPASQASSPPFPPTPTIPILTQSTMIPTSTASMPPSSATPNRPLPSANSPIFSDGGMSATESTNGHGSMAPDQSQLLPKDSTMPEEVSKLVKGFVSLDQLPGEISLSPAEQVAALSRLNVAAPEFYPPPALSVSTPVNAPTTMHVNQAPIHLQTQALDSRTQTSSSEESEPAGTAELTPTQQMARLGGLNPSSINQHCPDLLGVLNEARRYDPSASLGGSLVCQLGEYGVHTHRTNHLFLPTAVAINERTKEIVVCDTNHKLVKFFDSDGHIRAMIGNERMEDRRPFSDPSAVIIAYGETVEEDRVYIKCEHIIHRVACSVTYSEGPAVEAEIGRDIGLQNIYGLALTDTGHLVTLHSAREGTYQTAVVLLEPNGSEAKRFPLQPVALTAGPTSKPRFITVWHDRLLVSDLGRQKVYVVSLLTGESVLTVGQPGRGLGCFGFVSGVACDVQGNILVGDAKNNRLQLFDKSGKVVCSLDLKGREGQTTACPFPAGITLTSDARVICANRRHDIVRVFRLSANP